MKNNTKHNHHFLSKFYLKYWANDKNKVWIYDLNPTDRNRPNPSLLHIDDVCAKKNLYLIGDNLAIEDWADRNVETHCAETFRKIKAIEKIDENDVFFAKAFLALIMARHPMHEKSSEIILKYSARKTEPLNPLAQTTRLRMEINLIELDKLNLQVLYIPNEMDDTFVTSDVPFFIASWIVNSTRKSQIANQQSFNPIWFPISPKSLGFLSTRKSSSFYEEISDRTRINNINLELTLVAKDILIANNPNTLNSLVVHRKSP